LRLTQIESELAPIRKQIRSIDERRSAVEEGEVRKKVKFCYVQGVAQQLYVLQDIVGKLSLERAEFQHQVQSWEPRLADGNTKLRAAERDCETLQEEFTVRAHPAWWGRFADVVLQDWTDKATEKWSPKIDRPRASSKVQQEREKLQREVSQAEKAYVGYAIDYIY
jgi:DNA repair exonuclease SbcCD ATPase subunit